MQNLKNKYPQLFASVHGLEIGPGWYKLVDELAAQLEPLGVRSVQVKEKFGGLRFYIAPVEDDSTSEKVDALIREAEAKSFTLCEECGAPGTQFGTHYVHTRCIQHVPPELVFKTVVALHARVRNLNARLNAVYVALEGEGNG